MRSIVARWPWFALILSAAAAESIRGESGKETERVESLIKQLGDPSFAKRETATRELESLGEPVLPGLRRALATSGDFEIRTRSRQIIRTILLGLRKSPSLDMKLALIEAGEFEMGTRQGQAFWKQNENAHGVTISRPFLMGVHEVTQAEYCRVMKVNPSAFSADGEGKAKVAGMDTAAFPVDSVSWFDAVEFCNKLSALDGYEPCYKLTNVKRNGPSIEKADVAFTLKNGYRLPTEAEWEYACRAGTTTRFHCGNGCTHQQANLRYVTSGGYGGPSTTHELGRTAKVGSYKPNAWGLFDMHGNVAEWCWDWYDADYYGNSPPADPPGPEKGVQRILRGGNWMVTYENCRSATRFWHTPDEVKDYIGFRVARSP
jgi:formylglycine-generating enzyme required for sulfatase activity